MKEREGRRVERERERELRERDTEKETDIRESEVTEKEIHFTTYANLMC